MTLSNTLNRFVYNGNAVTDTFSFPALFYDNAHIVVTVDGVLKTEGTHYTVTGVALPAGGSVIFTVGNIPPAGTANVILERLVPLDQQADPQNFDGNPALSTEIVYDLMSMRMQQVQDQVSRAPQLSISTTLSSVKLPDPIDQEFPIWSGITGLMINSGVNITSLLAIETNAAASAAAALVSENSAASDVVLTNADVISTNADVVLTNADVVLTNADVVLTNADVVLTNADVVSAAASAATLQGTSVTSLLIATGSKVFTTQSGKQFNAGEWLLATSDANPTNYMHGQVTSYVGTTLTLNVTNIGGSGTLADWTITVSGTRGAIGTTGATGSTGAKGLQWQNAWVTTTAYAVDDAVQESGNSYICLVAHTAGTFATDLAAAKWDLLAQKGAAGLGSGDMLAANNLSDVVNASTSRTNLGLAIGINVAAFNSSAAFTNVTQTYTAQQNFTQATLTDAASITWNLGTQQVGSVTLAGNRTLANPTNMIAGGTYLLTVKQDATGTRTMAFSSAYKFPSGTAPSLTTAANAVDLLTFISDGTSMFGVSQGDLK